MFTQANKIGSKRLITKQTSPHATLFNEIKKLSKTPNIKVFHHSNQSDLQRMAINNLAAQPLKQKTGQPDDKYEQEADQVVEQMMRMPMSVINVESSSFEINAPLTFFTTPQLQTRDSSNLQLSNIHNKNVRQIFSVEQSQRKICFGGRERSFHYPRGTECDETHMSDIEASRRISQAWRGGVLAWFDEYRSCVRERAPRNPREHRTIGSTLRTKLHFLETHFRISNEIRRLGCINPLVPIYRNVRFSIRDFEKFANSVNVIVQRFREVDLGGVNPYCYQGPVPGARVDSWGWATPGSYEMTIYTDVFDGLSVNLKPAAFMHEAFHASFRNFNDDSYFNTPQYPGPSPLTNADSYSAFASIVNTGTYQNINVLEETTIEGSIHEV